MTASGEIKKFCIDNAGRMAAGFDIKTMKIEGRILAFDDNGRVLLEVSGSPKNLKIPNPLPRIPYVVGNWYRVIADCGTGVSVSWSSLKLLEGDAATTPIDNIIPSKAQAAPTTYVEAKQSKCGHSECDTWCHRRYAGIG